MSTGRCSSPRSSAAESPGWPAWARWRDPFSLIDAISPGFGYTGIIVATLGGLHPVGVAVAALFIGLIGTGAQTVSRALGVPVYLGDVVQATLLLVTLGMFLLMNYRIRIVRGCEAGSPACRDGDARRSPLGRSVGAGDIGTSAGEELGLCT
jgi:hypothetical protein